MSDEKKLTLSGRGTLGAGKGVETGKVRQSFSHGRSKPVVVERKRKRTLKKGPGAAADADAATTEQAAPQKTGEAKPAPAGGGRGGAQKPRRPQAGGRGGLTQAEIAARTGALRQAHEEAERRKVEEERRRREEEALREAREAEQAQAEQEEAAAETEARRRAEEAAKQAAEDKARKAREQEERRKAEDAARLEQESEEARKRTERARAAARAAGTPEAESADSAGARKKKGAKGAAAKKAEAAKASKGRGEEKRRSGKLTVTRALADDDERQRSEAAAKRRERRRRQREIAGDGDKAERKSREVVIPEAITVQELAQRMAEKAPAVIKTLMGMGVMATINQTLDQDTAQLVVEEFGHKVKRVSEADVEEGLIGDEDDAGDLRSRAPVVTIMGHVDHGKTSLLDALRKTDVVAGEAGGITQHIGAYQVQLGDGNKITFLDTPGHEAFTQMRQRGAGVTDIVVLVVAADDGIMPQTVEAINHAKAAEVPIIVAINKIDKPGADPTRVRNELLQHELVVEAMGGDIQDVEVSALQGTNLDKLQEAILLQSELLELKANPDRDADGVVIEAKLERGRGPVASLLVRRGTLKVGDVFVAGAEWGRVRALVDERGQQLKSAGPAQPVEVLGLQGTPSAGDDFAVVENESRAREIHEYRQEKLRSKRTTAAPASLESMFSAIREKQATEFPIVVKGDVQGSVEAIVSSLEKIGNEDIRARVLHAAVGGITESDVTLAAASEAIILGFNVRANKQARDAAEQNSVAIQYYAVIYDLIDDMRELMAGQLAPEVREETLGLAEVREVFTAGKRGRAAGCLVVDGRMRAGAKCRILRDDVVVYEGDIASLRRFKDDVREVEAGTECGLMFANFMDVKKGDQIECYVQTEHARKL
ncbi:translation initiation factor IF-2 [Rhodothalassium salexigens]|uniref:translation initiation factor IF-2 n=1 Tax=Rhodothalassium salexigens TaxID=1086 RepID=UPI001911D37F|nr:translation initiation factor IF-2 [Rhodothalassium salexigens]MBK5911301.1 translation initiation factor IF-2 [Rhodothalassium salexigens]